MPASLCVLLNAGASLRLFPQMCVADGGAAMTVAAAKN
jgi:hypothetical protein